MATSSLEATLKEQHLDELIVAFLKPASLAVLSAASRSWCARSAEGFCQLIKRLGARPPPNGGTSSTHFEQLLRLGRFSADHHRGISLSANNRVLRKAGDECFDSPDSNNVFLEGLISEQPGWAQFRVGQTRDEMLFGVTHQPAEVAEASGWSNTALTNVWIFAKAGHAYPTFGLGGGAIYGKPKRRSSYRGMKCLRLLPDSEFEECRIKEGDLVGVWVDPDKRWLKFYLNGKLCFDSVNENIQLPEAVSYGIYAMVDYKDDQVEIDSFGYGAFSPPSHHREAFASDLS